MLVIGLTGGIGSGKSTVAEIFAVLGIPVLKADELAKKLMESDAALKKKVIELLGTSSFTTNGLNTKYIAERVFSDGFLLDQLNALVHPVTIKATHEWAAQQNSPYVIKEAAILFESGAAAGLDYIIGVFAPEVLRLQRVMHRDGLTRDQVKERMRRQIDETIKMRLCDEVIVNDEQQLLIPQVLTLHHKWITLVNQQKE